MNRVARTQDDRQTQGARPRRDAGVWMHTLRSGGAVQRSGWRSDCVRSSGLMNHPGCLRGTSIMSATPWRQALGVVSLGLALSTLLAGPVSAGRAPHAAKAAPAPRAAKPAAVKPAVAAPSRLGEIGAALESARMLSGAP